MNLSEEVLAGWLSAAWLIQVGLAWPRRYESPLWAWIRIVSGAILFTWLELFIWHPTIPYLNYLFDVGAIIFIARFFVHRKIGHGA